MDLRDVAGTSTESQPDGNDAVISASNVVTEIPEATIEYVTMTTGAEDGDEASGAFHSASADPSVLYDTDGTPVDMNELSQYEKNIVMAVQKHLAAQHQNQGSGDIQEEEMDYEQIELIPSSGTAVAAEDAANSSTITLVSTVPQSPSEDVISSVMRTSGLSQEYESDAEVGGKKIKYWVVPEGSSRGRDKLYDSTGHSYTIKSKNRGSITWRCKMRSRGLCCKARVHQRGDQFVAAGEHSHDTSGKKIEVVKLPPPQKVYSVRWDVTPVDKRRKRKLRAITGAEGLTTQVTAGDKKSKLDGALSRVLNIAFDGKLPVSSQTTTATVVIVETPLAPRSKRKRTIPQKFTDMFIEEVDLDEESNDAEALSDMDQLTGLQHTDELLSPGFVKQLKVEQPLGDVEIQNGDSQGEEGTGKLTFRVVQAGSARRCDKLFDSQGYSYTIKHLNSDSVTWRCTMRNKGKAVCGATVRQWGKKFMRSDIEHLHPPRFGEEVNTVITNKMKEIMQSNPSASLPKVAREELQRLRSSGLPSHAIPKLDNLLRKVNYLKRRIRLENPKSLDFKLERTLIPTDFLRDDLKIADARHLIFATEEQVGLLKHSKLWYVDCAVCFENKPFYQLLTIHVFVRKEGSVKQVPALFVFMSSKTLDDYTAILQSIKLCAQEKIKLKKVVLQFESSVWNAFSTVFPDVKRCGSSCHFQQCVFDRMEDLGLKSAYEKDSYVNFFVKQLMMLAMVPYEFVGAVFTPLERKAPTKELAELCSSFRKMWLETSVWTLKSISGYDSPIRTEDETIGWNRQLNEMGWSTSSLYFMVQKLFNGFSQECEGCHTVSEKELKHYQKKEGTEVQKKIFKLWKSHQNGAKSPKGLMKSLAQYAFY